MVLDQQIPLEWAFKGPLNLTKRLGRDLDAADLAARHPEQLAAPLPAAPARDPEQLAAAFATPPALHRFPGSMAGRVQELCRVIVEQYDGDAANVWRDV